MQFELHSTVSPSSQAWSRYLSWLALFLVVGSFGLIGAFGQVAPTVRLTAYNTDGMNAGTARLTANVTVNAMVTGSTDQRIVWSLSGAGSISTSGVYQAPAVMPAVTAVTVTAALRAYPAVSAAYSMTLENAVPTIYNVYVANGYLETGITNIVTVHGAGFVPGSLVRCNGAVLSTTYESSDYLLAAVAVPVGATASLAMTVVTAAPGGGASQAFAAAVVTPRLWLSAVSPEGTNLGTARLGEAVSMGSSASGATSNAVVWRLTGAGAVSAAGVYQAPTVMPAVNGVTITASLQENPAVMAVYKISLYNAAPTIYNAYVLNGSILSGITNSVTIHGAGFTPSSVVLVNSARVPATYQSTDYLLAQVPVAASASGTLQVVVQASPSVGSSLPLLAPIAKVWLDVAAMAESQMNPTWLPVGGAIAFTSQLQGSGSSAPIPVVWSVVGAGSISSTGLYQAPNAMSANPGVQVYATAAANPAISTAYHFYLVQAAPVVLGSNPAALVAGAANVVTIYGNYLVPGTTLTLNGSSVPATDGTSDSLAVTLSPPLQQTAPMNVVLRNPDPNTAASASFALPMSAAATNLSAQVGLTPGLTIAQDFLGLSHEWTDPEWLIGNTVVGTNQAYVQMLTNLMLGSRHPLSIRIGGGSTDTTGEPSSGLGTTLAQLGTTLPIHYALGINLGANNLGLATDQASFFLGVLPAGSVQALEIGNEPDEYVWKGLRNANYNFANYLSDYSAWQKALAPLHSSAITLMGPSWGETQTLQKGPAFTAQEGSAVGIVSQHFYAGYQETQSYFPPDYLLNPGQAQEGPAALADAVTQAHAAHELFRVGEMNSLDGGGITGISDTFGAALWAIDTMFRFASVGVDGVNWHGLSGCAYCPYAFSVQNPSPGPRIYTLTHTNPLYYGWLFFQNATANGARLLPVSGVSNPNISVWATIDPAGAVRVAIINKDKQFAGNLLVSIAGYGTGSVGQLLAPGLSATSGVSIFGQTFDGATDGVIRGTAVAGKVQPMNGVYTVKLSPLSAAMLTLSQ